MDIMLEWMSQYGENQILSTAIICLILVFVTNYTGIVEKRWLPATATVIGAVVGSIFSLHYGDYFYSIGLGIIGGFASSGAYDFVKDTFRKSRKEQDDD